MLREAGALEVHVRISSPPVQWPCFYGIDFATRAELIANGLEIDGIRRSIGADSLGYVSLDGLVQATEQPRSRLCMACFDGQYPIELPAGNLIGKHLLEGVGKRASMPSGSEEAATAAVAELEAEYDDRAAARLVSSPGGSNALQHP
jgi:amidophosphoribosyltransferase